MMHPPAKPALARKFLEGLAGLAALVCLAGLFFALLHWRVNKPEVHLDFGSAAHDQVGGQNDE
jgi:hypothetical protein